MRPPPHAATSAPRNGGNGVIRGVTRRRHAGSQFLMLQNPHRSEPRASRRLQDLGAGPIGAEKTRPTRHLQRHFHEKTRPACQKTPILRCFERAGRTFSRTRRDNVATLKRTTPLLAPQQGTAETGITTAPEKCTKNTHFSPAKAMVVSIEARPAPAKAMTVSIPHGNKQAKATMVSDNRATWPPGPGCGARRRRGLVFLKNRMQFDWVKIQQGLKTLRFQR